MHGGQTAKIVKGSVCASSEWRAIEQHSPLCVKSIIDNQLCEAGAIVTSNISCVSGRDIIKFRKVVGLLNKREPI
jgi:hypothetical protein